MGMVVLDLGLRDGGGWVDAGVDGIAANGDGWVEGLGVEVLEVDRVVGPRHRVWHCRRSDERRIWRCLVVKDRCNRTGGFLL